MPTNAENTKPLLRVSGDYPVIVGTWSITRGSPPRERRLPSLKNPVRDDIRLSSARAEITLVPDLQRYFKISFLRASGDYPISPCVTRRQYHSPPRKRRLPSICMFSMPYFKLSSARAGITQRKYSLSQIGSPLLRASGDCHKIINARCLAQKCL